MYFLLSLVDFLPLQRLQGVVGMHHNYNATMREKRDLKVSFKNALAKLKAA